MSSDPTFVTRLAPSPTGVNTWVTRTHLITWLMARKKGGRIVLRIGDIDSPRVKFGATPQAMDDLRWLGLDWDIGPIVQTVRLVWYSEALDRLKERELVYPCTCTRSDVELAASAPHADGVEPVYPGTCSSRRVADADALGDRPFAWRIPSRRCARLCRSISRPDRAQSRSDRRRLRGMEVAGWSRLPIGRCRR